MLTTENIEAIHEFVRRWNAGERGFTGSSYEQQFAFALRRLCGVEITSKSPGRPAGMVIQSSAQDHGVSSDYLPEEVVCERYGRGPKTIRRWVEDGRINFPPPKMLVRGRRYYQMTDIEAWERRQTV
jgi:predicted DNA-binding transcriptional regulator AlpA